MKFINKFGSKIIGVFAVIVGVLGLALPILPGWVLIFVGLELLGFNILFWQRFKEYVKKKVPKKKK